MYTYDCIYVYMYECIYACICVARVALAIMEYIGDKLVLLNDEKLQMGFKG